MSWSFMEFDYHLFGLVVGDAVAEVVLGVEPVASEGQSHPRCPQMIAGAFVAVMLTHYPTTGKGFACSEAHMGLLTSFRSFALRDDTHQRTGRTAGRLLRRQLNRCE